MTTHDTPKEFILRLFPNTGHQFFSLDLEELLSRRRDPQGRPIPPPTADQLRRFVELQQPDKAPASRRDKVAGWLPWSPDTPWILYRYDFMADPRVGGDEALGSPAAPAPQQRAVLLLAIESNLGDLDRGILLGLSSGPAGQPSGEHPAFSELRRRNTPLPETDPEAPPPYFSRPLELRADWPEGGLWLEDAFASPNVPLPSRLTPQERREFDFILPRETVRVEWAESQGDRPVEVDLVVDLGNSRTVALLLEDHGADAGNLPFGKRVEPVHFLPRGWAYNHPQVLQSRKLEPFGIIDSWILLHRSTFANIEPPFSGAKLRTFVTSLPTRPGEEAAAHLIDQRFTSLAPVLVGGGKDASGAARTLARAVTLRDSEGAPFFLSSPKRYAWDDTSIGSTRQYWKQVPNAHDADQAGLAPLEGLVRLLMNPSSRDNDLPPRELHDDPFDPPTDFLAQAKYPRSDAICWFALSILESAYRQINSIDFLRRTFPERGGIIRRLRRVRVTYPAGWSGQERERYLDQWRRACSLFALAHLTRGDQAPELVSPDTNIDEAIASQLPLVVAEIKNLGHNADEWLTLFGDGAEARLLSLDIGGGTTDIAVVAYSRPEQQNSGGAELASSIRYRDGHNIAGDVLVKELVETLILPAWLKIRGDILFANNPEARRLLEVLFRSPGQQTFTGIEACLSQILRLALIPLANEILAKVNDAERQGLDKLPPIRVSRVADAGSILELNRLVIRQLVQNRCPFGDLRVTDLTRLLHEPEFRAWFEKVRSDAPQKLPFALSAELVFTLEEVRAVIDKVFTPVIRSLADVVHHHDVNLVIVSGKPSELVHMRAILQRELPLPAQRIIQMRGHSVGEWYPVTLVEDGRIRDAKTVTVTGAALFEDIYNRNTTGFRLIQQADGATPEGDDTTWGVLKAHSVEFDEEAYPLFAPGSKNQAIDFPQIQLETVFGRRLTSSGRAEPVYRLDYVAPPGIEPPKARDALVRARIRRVDLPGGIGDALELVPGSVAILSGPPGLDPACIQLRLRTMVENAFWMDQPRFLVDFSRIGTR